VNAEHTPCRPSWECLACGRPWPCDPARETLSLAMDFFQLAMFMWDKLEESVVDDPGSPWQEVYERFIKWIR
jgi:hypothetical protein